MSSQRQNCEPKENREQNTENLREAQQIREAGLYFLPGDKNGLGSSVYCFICPPITTQARLQTEDLSIL